MSNGEFVASYSEKASARFNTAIGRGGISDKNTISACIHGNQTITDLIVIVFVRISSKPEDKGHDYGHGKYESPAR